MATSAQREWLRGYSGQSVDELIALASTHRIDSLVVAFEEALGRKQGALTPEEQIILAVEALEREVNNGGYDQFFSNAPDFAPLIVDALRRIGCEKTAGVTQQAAAALEKPERAEVFSKCDDSYLSDPEPIAERLFDFIKANKSRITFTP